MRAGYTEGHTKGDAGRTYRSCTDTKGCAEGTCESRGDMEGGLQGGLQQQHRGVMCEL